MNQELITITESENKQSVVFQKGIKMIKKLLDESAK